MTHKEMKCRHCQLRATMLFFFRFWFKFNLCEAAQCPYVCMRIGKDKQKIRLIKLSDSGANAKKKT